jgi:hypothetical protein
MFIYIVIDKFPRRKVKNTAKLIVALSNKPLRAHESASAFKPKAKALKHQKKLYGLSVYCARL